MKLSDGQKQSLLYLAGISVSAVGVYLAVDGIGKVINATIEEREKGLFSGAGPLMVAGGIGLVAFGVTFIGGVRKSF